LGRTLHADDAETEDPSTRCLSARLVATAKTGLSLALRATLLRRVDVAADDGTGVGQNLPLLSLFDAGAMAGVPLCAWFQRTLWMARTGGAETWPAVEAGAEAAATDGSTSTATKDEAAVDDANAQRERMRREKEIRQARGAALSQLSQGWQFWLELWMALCRKAPSLLSRVPQLLAESVEAWLADLPKTPAWPVGVPRPAALLAQTQAQQQPAATAAGGVPAVVSALAPAPAADSDGTAAAAPTQWWYRADVTQGWERIRQHIDFLCERLAIMAVSLAEELDAEATAKGIAVADGSVSGALTVARLFMPPTFLSGALEMDDATAAATLGGINCASVSFLTHRVLSALLGITSTATTRLSTLLASAAKGTTRLDPAEQQAIVSKQCVAASSQQALAELCTRSALMPVDYMRLVLAKLPVQGTVAKGDEVEHQFASPSHICPAVLVTGAGEGASQLNYLESITEGCAHLFSGLTLRASVLLPTLPFAAAHEARGVLIRALQRGNLYGLREAVETLVKPVVVAAAQAEAAAAAAGLSADAAASMAAAPVAAIPLQPEEIIYLLVNGSADVDARDDCSLEDKREMIDGISTLLTAPANRSVFTAGALLQALTKVLDELVAAYRGQKAAAVGAIAGPVPVPRILFKALQATMAVYNTTRGALLGYLKTSVQQVPGAVLFGLGAQGPAALVAWVAADGAERRALEFTRVPLWADFLDLVRRNIPWSFEVLAGLEKPYLEKILQAPHEGTAALVDKFSKWAIAQRDVIVPAEVKALVLAHVKTPQQPKP
jgi:hypothetical protein